MSVNKKRSGTRKKIQTKNSNLNIDPIEAFNVFTQHDLDYLSSGSTTPDIPNKIITTSQKSSTISESIYIDSDDDFVPKTQSVRKTATKRKANQKLSSNTSPEKISRLSNEGTTETPKNNTTELRKSCGSTISKPFNEMRISTTEQQKPKINVSSVKIINKAPIHNSQEAGPSTDKKTVRRNIFGTGNSSKKDNDEKTIKTLKEKKSQNARSKVSNTNKDETNSILKTPEKNKKPVVEMRINSPKKSPSSAQKQQDNIEKAGPSTGKNPVCRKIFETENTNNTQILKDYDINVKLTNSNKTLTGKINISNENKLISIDLCDENSSMETETTVSTTPETPKKSKLLETPIKSPKRVKPKDSKTYKQSSLNSFVTNNTSNSNTSNNNTSNNNKSNNNTSNKKVPNKSINNSKNTAIKTNSKYTLESNTRVYENVKNILNWVFEKEHFSILFTRDETELLNNFFQLTDNKLTILCLRLFTRQHKWYNLTNLCTELNLKDDSYNYQEVLTQIQVYVDTDYTDETLDVLLDHLSASDLRDICNSFKITAPTRKEAMQRKLLDYTNKQCTLTFIKNSDQILRDRCEEKLGICIKLKTEFKSILYMIHLLYSITNSFSTINDIYNVIYKVKSNTVKYPVVQTDSTRIFADRTDFLNYSEATLLRKEYEDQVLKKDIRSQYLLCVEAHKRLLRLLNDTQQLNYDRKKPLFLRRFSASWIYCKVLSNGSLNLGKHYAESVCQWLTDMLEQEIYCLYKRGQWYIQLSLINQSHLKKFVEAADNIIAGINDKHVTEVTKYELSIRGSKIRTTKLPQLKYDELQYALLPNLTTPVERTFEAKAVYLNEQGRKLYFERITNEGKEYASVEETAINYYKENHNYTHGVHCEGRLLTTLFIIYFWDIIYEMNVPNTFITEIQTFPLDLFTTDFYTNREERINARLNDIRNNWNLEELLQFFTTKLTSYNVEINSMCSFDCDEKTYLDIIKSIGKVILAAVFERLAKDYRQFNSGLPDLFLWNNRDFKCAFVEVKSENDTLSTNQILWINYLHNFHACIEVCHVLNKGSKKSKKF